MDVEAAAEHLGQVIGKSRLLLVIDDVWRVDQVRPFLRGGPNCVRLVTTRLPYVLHSIPHEKVPIDEMHPAEAAGLIAKNLPAAEPGAAVMLPALADRLGNWAQMLAIANGWLRVSVEQGERLTNSIARYERRLARDGPFKLDAEIEGRRTARSGFASRPASRISAQWKPRGPMSWLSFPRTNRTAERRRGALGRPASSTGRNGQALPPAESTVITAIA